MTASLSASYSPSPLQEQKNVGTKPSGCTGNCNWWNYKSTLAETSGNVGIKINSRKKCYENIVGGGPSWCDPVKSDIANFYGTDYINAGSQISRPSDFVYFTAGYKYKVTETFWGEDDNKNAQTASYSFIVIS